ncbi:hypothetical protein ACSBR1_027884 [Camellia fascicularis]
MSSDRAGDGDDNDKDSAAVAKTAGLVVFSGIAMSILKALVNPLSKPNLHTNHNYNDNEIKPFGESAQVVQQHHSVSPQEPVVKVSIEEIKEANGLTGDTIYAGKKLIIP